MSSSSGPPSDISAGSVSDDDLLKRRSLQRHDTLHRADHFKHSNACLLNAAAYNKGTAFTPIERQNLQLEGLLPPQVETMEQQVARVKAQFEAFDEPINRYIFLSVLAGNNQTLFYRFVVDNLRAATPVIYTPTVGLACQRFGNIWRASEGMYLTPYDKGRMRRLLDHWPFDDVDIIVVTDGSRILGLGDLGANGMGIPIGKLSLYVAAAGFHPSRTLPVMLDFGTNNEKLRHDPLYLGLAAPRVPDPEYLELVDEFMDAVTDKWPDVLVQHEDFSGERAFQMLDRYRNKHLMFNDDIQGTGAVILSGFINAVKLAGVAMASVRLVFLGAGSAGVGVADRIVDYMVKTEGMELEDARARFWLVDSRGLVTADRGDKLADHKQRFARTDNDGQQYGSLADTVAAIKPHGIIGLSGMGGMFTEDIVRSLNDYSNRPIIFALSNPTSKAECTAEQAYTWTDGKGIFASGSPFDEVELDGKKLVPGQGNNMYIFPGLGLGAVLAKASTISDKMINAAAQSLADFVTDAQLAKGLIYPDIDDIRLISKSVAIAVIKQSFVDKVSQLPIEPLDKTLDEMVEKFMYFPTYVNARNAIANKL